MYCIYIYVYIYIHIYMYIYYIYSAISAPTPLTVIQSSVVGCKIPWKENSLISRGIGEFIFTRRVLAFFRVNPATSFNQSDLFIRSAFFNQSSGQPRVNPGKQERGGATKTKHRRVFFSRYLAANDASSTGTRLLWSRCRFFYEPVYIKKRVRPSSAHRAPLKVLCSY